MGLAAVPTSSLIGVAIACGGNILISLALTVQKLAHRRQNEELVASRSGSSSGSDSPDMPPNSSTDLLSPSPNIAPAAVPVLLTTASPTSEDLRSNRETEVTLLDPSSHVERDEIQERDEGRGHRATSRSKNGKRRSPSPSPIRVPPHYQTDISIGSPDSQHPSRRGHHTQRKQHGEHQSREDGEEENDMTEVEEGMYLKSKLWWLGMILIAVGEGGNFLSYAFAPASVVAPLGTVALIANCIFAPLLLRERFHAKELLGMVLAILGAVTVVWSSNSSNPRLDPPALQHAIAEIPFIVYTALNLTLMTILVLLSRSVRFGARFIGIDIGVCALFGGYTVLSTKALSSLLSTMFLSAFEWWITWVLVAVLVGTSILQVKYLNRALMRFQCKEVIPTQFVFFSLAAIVGSAVLYQEFRGVPISQFVNFTFGISTTFFGVYLLTKFSDQGDRTGQPESSSTHQTPTRVQRATSSASLNLLLPTTSRLPTGERTPLLIPIAQSPETIRQFTDSTTPSSAPGTLPKLRLVKRTSTSDFTPTLGINSQAGFLLMATTPPTTSAPNLMARRDRSASRGGLNGQYTDEEQARTGRRSSLASGN